MWRPTVLAANSLRSIQATSAAGHRPASDPYQKLSAGIRVRQGPFLATLAATLFQPVTAAVGIGVGPSLLLQVNQEAVDLTVVRLTHGENGSLVNPRHQRRFPVARSRSSPTTPSSSTPTAAIRFSAVSGPTC